MDDRFHTHDREERPDRASRDDRYRTNEWRRSEERTRRPEHVPDEKRRRDSRSPRRGRRSVSPGPVGTSARIGRIKAKYMRLYVQSRRRPRSRSRSRSPSSESSSDSESPSERHASSSRHKPRHRSRSRSRERSKHRSRDKDRDRKREKKKRHKEKRKERRHSSERRSILTGKKVTIRALCPRSTPSTDTLPRPGRASGRSSSRSTKMQPIWNETRSASTCCSSSTRRASDRAPPPSPEMYLPKWCRVEHYVFLSKSAPCFVSIPLLKGTTTVVAHCAFRASLSWAFARWESFARLSCLLTFMARHNVACVSVRLGPAASSFMSGAIPVSSLVPAV